MTRVGAIFPVLLVAAVLSASIGTARAAQPTSAWSPTDHARMRLIDAGPAPSPGTRLVGVEVELDPEFLTYWRTPGEAGVPPTTDIAGSANVASAELLFPAPGRFDEGGAEAFGYKTHVIFPVLVTPKEPGKPVALRMALAFAVCSKLCLPAQAAAELALTADGVANPDPVRDALARVPKTLPLGATASLAVEKVELASDGQSLTVMAWAKDGTAALFPEAPDPWFVQADAGIPQGADRRRFTLRILARPAEASTGTLPLRLTLVSNCSAIETSVDLDPGRGKP